MNILVAMDSLKGSLSSKEANQAIADGLTLASKELVIDTVPIADGGEGTVDALVSALGGTMVHQQVTGPLGEPVNASYGLIKNDSTAVIEVAEACGLPLVSPSDLHPLKATTYGVGELIANAIKKGCSDIIIGLGGSSTTDAGVGMLQALGFQFLDKSGCPVRHGGRALQEIAAIDTSQAHPLLQHTNFHTICDVNNPLHGPNGAAFVFSPQKGADIDEVTILDQGLAHFSTIVMDQLGIDLQIIPGSGAAGGLGAALSGFLHSPMLAGVDFILSELNLKEKLSHTDIVFTGEGKFDFQSSMGKAPSGIAKLAQTSNTSVIVLAGDISDAEDQVHNKGVDAYFTIVRGPISLNEAMASQTTYSNLKQTAEQLGRLLLLKK
ncbi:glycerate kinase [Halobacillus litoralis]|uniref:glycerate kinase family protein n=1 Tax=Halobacillus litoralis TaxID=45668 RepID=UPI001CFD6057|nr:glycerate kinase [Halobacillus litoralis]WLR46626.1 glycerate kinase [Halobacillus litoralis]